MRIAIVGYTGFVGSNLAAAISTPHLYNSANIAEIRGQQFDLLINAGVSSLRWKANQEPQQDREGIARLWDNVRTVQAGKLLHISTMDVLSGVGPQYEDSPIDESRLLPYGLHRRELERWVAEQFPNHLIVRFPHLYGRGLKKNFLWDLMHDNALHLTDDRDVFQFYHLDNLWRDLTHFLSQDANLVHVSVAPLTAREVARECFDLDFQNTCQREPRNYDLRSRLSHRNSAESGYMYTRDEAVAAIRDFVRAFPKS